MTDLLQFTINVPNPTVNVTSLCTSCGKILRSSEAIPTFIFAGNSTQNAN